MITTIQQWYLSIIEVISQSCYNLYLLVLAILGIDTRKHTFGTTGQRELFPTSTAGDCRSKLVFFSVVKEYYTGLLTN